MDRALKIGLALLGLLAATPGFALYKVVSPDGRVSYTDRAPQDDTDKVQTLPSAGGAGAAAADAALPFELRQVAQRFPVTYYTTENCAPCDSGRELLRQRGVPYTEKSVTSSADAEAFKRLGGQKLPLLQIGRQQVRSFSAGEWNGYLDTAGYPAQSRLPRSYRFAEATPLVAPAAPAAPAQAAAPRPAPPRPAAPPPADSGGNAPPGFRF